MWQRQLRETWSLGRASHTDLVDSSSLWSCQPSPLLHPPSQLKALSLKWRSAAVNNLEKESELCSAQFSLFPDFWVPDFVLGAKLTQWWHTDSVVSCLQINFFTSNFCFSALFSLICYGCCLSLGHHCLCTDNVLHLVTVLGYCSQ